ncbi:hypothetical protein B7P34_01960 [Streptosporangium nondiastaticum]|uniref:Uncharacterized protein n=1 Tax=Streptosporangium nondiastaticum TaxID=35764 RepID=A0A9X7JUZ0_9ACTN|nr:RidA family protein [Streptosporangium nondiastaticum]PSJ30349.1 hypothetical protein B7P34_01960 [Streptosporangium nondiastaticum]
MTDKKVLLLGGHLETPAVLRGLGADVTHVHAAAGAGEAPADLPTSARGIPVTDPADPRSVTAGLRRYGIAVTEFDLVCTPDEDLLATAAVLDGGRGGAAPADALLPGEADLREKQLTGAGIPVAGPWPQAGHAHAPEDHALRIDGVVRDGDVLFVSVGRRLPQDVREQDIPPGHDTVVATQLLHPGAHEELYDRARELAGRSAAALGHRDGVFRLEALGEQGRLAVASYATGVPTGALASAIRLQHGVDLEQEWARSVLGLGPAAASAPAAACFGVLSLAGATGVDDEHAVTAVVEGPDEQRLAGRLLRLARGLSARTGGGPEAARAGSGQDRGLVHLSHPAGVAPSSGYTHVVTGTGRVAAIAGQMPFDAAGELVGPGDPTAQARQVFTNMERCLAAAGATFDDVIKLTYFVTDIAFVPRILSARDEFIDTERPPASTVVQIVALYRPDLLLEVDALALLPVVQGAS